EAGKVILPVSVGGLTTPVVTSRHLRQTQAQDTTLFRSGHRPSLDSTLLTMSPSSSGSILDHRSSSFAPAPASTSAPPLRSPPSSAPSALSRGGGFLTDEPLDGKRNPLCRLMASLLRTLGVVDMMPLSLGSLLTGLM
ncbi:hypothetical protein MUK42_32910, partial [Musa troglodytarum]